VSVRTILEGRRSVRAFRPDPVPEGLLRDILGAALRAPSGGNLQPWRVIALAGEARETVTPVAQRALMANPEGEDDERPIYPGGLEEPFRSRRFAVGEAMYEALGIPRGDKPARLAWLAQNFAFFGAPVGLFFVTRQRFGHHQWSHVGMLMQSVALLAEEEGLGTCMQEAWAKVRRTMHDHLGLGSEEVIVSGMALGWPDEGAPVNRWRSERAALDEVAEFRGFEEDRQ
jgi:nitroreductase